ncbi:hypothetical protein IB224_11860 [Pseudomonas sp. PDM11]|nr:hypothetical protein [Pseudomonas sp. PDM11]
MRRSSRCFHLYASSQGYTLVTAALMACVILAGDMLFQIPLGWLSDRFERRALSQRDTS